MLILIAPEFRYANFAEAALWVVIGLVVAVRAATRGTWRRGSVMLLVLTLLAFGASDVVEAQMGAWWRPWWLLLWKGACVASFLVVFLNYRRAKRGDGGNSHVSTS